MMSAAICSDAINRYRFRSLGFIAINDTILNITYVCCCMYFPNSSKNLPRHTFFAAFTVSSNFYKAIFEY
ncbi:hypothetical protein I7I48_00447 [Histoplasma ohiense]|nr:hypothetical protein I7I48_00447 [Histoplasma ohiense (nom. inval.)]